MEKQVALEAVFSPGSLEIYRAYLHVLARVRLGSWLQGRLDPSDIVQETLLKAHRSQGQFRGQTEAEFRGYLRRILANTIADAGRRWGDLEQVELALEQSSAKLDAWLAAEQSSPSEQVQRAESLVQLAEALERLPADERTALEMRFLREPACSLAAIAAHLNRPSAKAVAGLLARGLERLRQGFGGTSGERRNE